MENLTWFGTEVEGRVEVGGGVGFVPAWITLSLLVDELSAPPTLSFDI